MKVKQSRILWHAILSIVISSCGHAHSGSRSVDDDYQIAVYYFPNYHVDRRNERKFGEGWMEWELLKAAKPRFDGHQQPKVPQWGYTDEADPKQMAQKIEAAAGHGVDVFIFDWYYYDDGLFLERALEEGFMKAANNDQMKFSLMWANHDYPNVFPYTAGEERIAYYPGKIAPDTWDRMTDYIIDTYFSHPSYWLIHDAPYFSIYDLDKFIASFGGLEAAVDGLTLFREKVRKAGFKDLHANIVLWGSVTLPGAQSVADPELLIQALGFNSFTSYVWVHHGGLDSFPATDYNHVKDHYFKYAEQATQTHEIPYFPHVSMGWDSSPRTNQDNEFINYGYPYTPVVTGNTPAAFKQALYDGKAFMDKHGSKVLTINSWNEWTEGSYLEPDTVNGMAYLEAIKAVFAPGR